jgi:hypothetical protein
MIKTKIYMDDRINADLGIYSGEWVDAVVDLNKVVLFYPDNDDEANDCVTVMIEGYDKVVMLDFTFEEFSNLFMSNPH